MKRFPSHYTTTPKGTKFHEKKHKCVSAFIVE